MSEQTPDKGDTYRSVWRYLATVPFRQDYVETAGLRTRFVEAGNPGNPALVLIHGTGGHWEAFCANIGPLSEHFHVFALDLMGCGFTDKPDKPYEISGYVDQVIGFMDAMKIDRASFIGVSLGSWVVTRIASQFPGRTDRVILVAPSGLLPIAASVKQALDVRRDSTDHPTWAKVSATLADLYYDRSSIIDDIVAVRLKVYSLPETQRVKSRMLTLFDPEIRKRNVLTEDELRSIQAPVLLIKHVDVEDFFLEHANVMEHLLPNARAVEMRKVSHWAQFEDPDTFNRIATDFLLPG